MQNIFHRLFTAIICGAVLLFWGTAVSAADPVNTARCKGNGTISFAGKGTITISGDGVLIVSDNASLDFEEPQEDGNAVKTDGPDCIESGDYCIYLLGQTAKQADRSIVKIKAQIRSRGSRDMNVSFAGANIGVTASGTAKLILKGYGIYIYDKTIGKWAVEGTTINLQ
jgi:hypothetical protein